MQLAECAQLCLNLGGVDILVNRVRTCIDHFCVIGCACALANGDVARVALALRASVRDAVSATRQCPGR